MDYHTSPPVLRLVAADNHTSLMRSPALASVLYFIVSEMERGTVQLGCVVDRVSTVAARLGKNKRNVYEGCKHASSRRLGTGCDVFAIHRAES